MLNGLDLFSGIGGLTLALKSWVTPIAYCEREPYAQGVLMSRMEDGDLPWAPIWDDITTLNGSSLPLVDIIYGGFPCQDVSVAGARRGVDGERTGLFREAVRLVRECRPEFVFLENVPGIRSSVHVVRGELEAIGYDCRDGFLSAAEVGAPHIRNRWWLLAHAKRDRRRPDPTGYRLPKKSEKLQSPHRQACANHAAEICANVADAEGVRRKGSNKPRGCDKGDCARGLAELTRSNFRRSWWATEPDVGRVANGVPNRSHRLRGLGNAVVPLCARQAFQILSGIGGEIA